MGNPLFEPPVDGYSNITLAPLWVPNISQRSTFHIIWSCTVTLVLCTWTILHPRVPTYGVRNSTWRRTRILGNRCLLMFHGLWFPDLLVVEAVTDYFYACKLCEKLDTLKLEGKERCLVEAKKVKVEVKEVTKEHDGQPPIDSEPLLARATNPLKGVEARLRGCWKFFIPPELERALYVGIGGYEIDMDHKVPQQSSEQYPQKTNGQLPLTHSAFFILSALQLAPKITIQEINDKSKTDPVGKALACFQAIWMLAQVIARRANGLPSTLLEFNTVINSACALMASLLWLNKPQGVNEPTKVPIPESRVDPESKWRVLLWVEDILEWNAPSESWSQDYPPKRRRWPWENQPNGSVGSKKAPAILRCHVDNRNLADGSTNPIRWTLHETDWDEGRFIWETQSANDPLIVCVRTFRVHAYHEQFDPSATSADRHDCEAPSLPRQLLDKVAHITCFRFSTGPTDHQGHLWIDRQQAELLLNFSLGKSTQVGVTCIDWKRYQNLIQELGTLRPDSPKKLLRYAAHRIRLALRTRESESGLAHIVWQPEDLCRWACMPLFGVTYGGVHLIQWHKYFPSLLERYLWRWGGCFIAISSACMVLGMALIGLGVSAASRIEDSLGKMSFVLDPKKWAQGKPCDGQLLLKCVVFIIFWILAGILGGISVVVWFTYYVIWRVGRVYFFVEGIASLRSLPEDVYKEVDWIPYWPHI